MSRFKAGSLVVMLVVGLSACGLSPGAKSTYADGMTADEYSAAYQMALARCERQTNSCSSFASRDQCVEAKLEASATDARLRRCSDPVDPAQVQSCVADIKRGECGTGIAQLDACTKTALCPYASEEGTL